MKAQVVLGMFALVMSVKTEAPYPPRGFRPQGQQFPTPNRVQQNIIRQNQYQAPTTSQNNYNSNGNQYEVSRIREATQNQNAYNTIDARYRQQEQNYAHHENPNTQSNNQNYISIPRDEFRQRGYPEPTTKKPKVENEPRNEDPADPNVAISTAVANGQIYYLSPNGLLQRVFKARENGEESESEGNAAESAYQSANPALSPLFAYTAPLVRIN